MLLDTRIMKLCFSDRKDFIDKKKKKKNRSAYDDYLKRQPKDDYWHQILC